MRPPADLVITGAAEVVTCEPCGEDPLGRIPGGEVAIRGDRILAVAEAGRLGAEVDVEGARVVDAAGGVVAPGFVDGHTHLVFGGSRVREFAARLAPDAGDPAALGIPTGIAASVEMTRAADTDELVEAASRRLASMLAAGTTTAESKSGYGLTTEEELRLLEVNRRLDAAQPVDVVSTFLGAHAVPEGETRDAYVARVVTEMIPEVVARGLAEFCDVFCDEGYFGVDDARCILEAGRAAGLGLKIHTDQYSRLGGAELAAELGVVSADHLNHADEESLRALAAAGVTGVVTPVLDLTVRHPRPFDGRAMRNAGLELAVATDLCPGCWAESMQPAVRLACLRGGLSPAEAMLGATRVGARSAGLEDRGALAPGLLADLQVWSVPTLEDLVYRIGSNVVARVIKRGKVVI
ncbi:MAG: imidazolonepropionase [Gemmatimonadota bacterium]